MVRFFALELRFFCVPYTISFGRDVMFSMGDGESWQHEGTSEGRADECVANFSPFPAPRQRNYPDCRVNSPHREARASWTCGHLITGGFLK